MGISVKFYFILLLIIFSSCFVSAAQSLYTVSGTVQDSTGKALSGANIRLITGKDTTNSTSDESGVFTFNKVRSANFEVLVSFLGFKTQSARYNNNQAVSSFQLPAIALKPAINQLGEVVVKDKVQAVTLKGDTVEYNAAAYHAGKDDMVDDLLKQLPGIKVDENDNVTTATGDPVMLLHVNGKTFFTNNVTEFISQLPAGIVAKLQLIDSYGDDAAITGIKSGKPMKMLNLVIKPGMDHGQFGDLTFTGSTTQTYGVFGAAHIWNGSKQIAIGGGLNKMSNKAGVGNASNAANIVYNDQWGKYFKPNFGYDFVSSNQNGNNNSNSETATPLGTLYNSTNSFNGHKSFSNNLSGTIGYDNGRTYIKIESSIHLNTVYNANMLNSLETGIINQRLVSASSQNQRTPRVEGYFEVNQKIGKANSLNTSVSLQNNKVGNNQFNNNETGYLDTAGHLLKDSILNTYVTNMDNVASKELKVIYRHEFAFGKSVNINYQYDKGVENNDFATSALDSNKMLRPIDSLTDAYTYTTTTQRFGIQINFATNDIYLTADLSLQALRLNGDYLNTKYNFTKTEENVIPSLSVRYQLTKVSDIEIDDFGDSTSPGYDQLRPVADTRNLQNIIIGNPNLKPGFENKLELKYDNLSNFGFHFGVNYETASNSIATDNLLVKDTLGSLKQETFYRNVNGTRSFGGVYNVGIPFSVDKKVYHVEFDGILQTNKDVFYNNGAETYSKNISWAQKIAIDRVRLKKWSLSGYASYAYSNTAYAIANNFLNKTQTLIFSARGGWGPTEKEGIFIEANKIFNYGYLGSLSNNPFLVNAAVKHVVKKNRLECELNVHDIFNQANVLSRAISSNTITETHNTIVSRYATLRIILILKNFAKNNSRFPRL